ncbi:MAG: LysM peptidoglycan-binding domain-containing protein [Polyangiaceae bacterium]|nr:LysM peptidoglycan-binding domain-containing protein [Polyangiaceae bacterium]
MKTISLLSLTILASLVAPLAQAQVTAAGGAAPAAGGTTTQSTSTTSTTTESNYFMGGIAPPPPGEPLGGGNATSSGQFELARPSGASNTVRGGENGAFFMDSPKPRQGDAGHVPAMHTVKKGDTLWDICDSYYRNPYLWPKVWSINPTIQNPHWIEPGDQIKLRQGGTADGAMPEDPKAAKSIVGGYLDKRRTVSRDSIFLRDEGFIEDNTDENWGEISGSPSDKMFLSQFDEAYVRIIGNKEPTVGQELTVFRPIRSVASGKLVEIQGTLRVTHYDAKEKLARGKLTDATDIIERGARVGPVERRLYVVPPVAADVDVKARVIASVHPHNFYGQNQVVFIDKGAKDGLKVGNRLFVMRKGDTWRDSLFSEKAGRRLAIESEEPARLDELPRAGSASAMPENMIAEIRVISTKQASSTCIVTQARVEIELNEEASTEKGK